MVLISSVLLKFVNGFVVTTRPQITAAMATGNHNRQQVMLAMGMIQTNSWLAGSLCCSMLKKSNGLNFISFLVVLPQMSFEHVLDLILRLKLQV